MAASNQSALLEATYVSPTGTEQWLYAQKDIAQNPPTQDRIDYISKLRADTTSLQAQVNKFLTDKMNEEKQATQVNDTSKLDDAKEEENYGEEADGV